MTKESNNKRISLNSLFLFLRMLLLMCVGLLTSRVVLASLGAEDYGIYNVVGSVVVLFVFLNYAMMNATQRYITYELGKNDFVRLNKVFCTSINIHIVISLIILFFVETAGLWFLYNKLLIPTDRLESAFWVMQFSAVATIVSVISVPYNALIIAHEKMSAFAYISIFDAVCKLGVAYYISISSHDRLIVYSVLLLMIGVIDRLIYNVYCHRKFPESHYRFYKDIPLMKEMAAFAGWSLTGNIAFVAATQGLNMLLNMFFNPAVNAARGIAVQVQSVLVNFSTNVENAIKPQITKSYAVGEIERMSVLSYASARFSFYTLFLVAAPVIVEIHFVLSLWLKDVPPHTEMFVILILIITLVDSLSNPLLTIVQSTGRIKKYQMVVGLIYMAILPLSYIGLKCFEIPEVVFVINLIIVMILQIVKVKIVCPSVGMSVPKYFKKVYLPAFVVSAMIFLISLIPFILMQEGFGRLLVVSVTSSVSLLLAVYMIGIDKYERMFIKNKIAQLYQNKICRNSP